MNNEERNEWRRKLIAAHICPICRNQDAYTLGGRVLCANCAEADRERTRRRRETEAGKQADRDSVRRCVAKRRERGRCVHCGKRAAETGHTLCSICLAYERRCAVERRRRECNWPRGANGYCWQCNKRKAIEGKHLCEECRNMKMACLEKAKEKRYAECQQG